MFVEKKAGKLANLQEAIADRTPHAAIGLAHTRWATHGRPNDLNAHPHQDCTGNITVIHNGIIENFRELRDGLEARGHVLTSETDTEALAHLVEEAYRGDLADARPRVPAQGRGRVRARRDAPRRDQPARRGAPERAARRGAQRRGELHRERRLGDPRPHEPGRVPRGGRRRRRPTHGRGGDRHRRAAPGARGHADRLDPRGRREGRLRALHAQGDQRAARGAPPVAGGPGHGGRPDPRARGRQPRRGLPARHPGRDRRLWHRVVRGARRRGGDPGLDGAPGAGHGRAPSSATRRRRWTRTRS